MKNMSNSKLTSLLLSQFHIVAAVMRVDVSFLSFSVKLT